MISLRYLALGSAFAVAAAAHCQFAHLVLHSEPGDYIGQGQDWDVWYTPESGGMSAAIFFTLADGSPSVLNLYALNDGETVEEENEVELIFSTNQLGIPIQPGTYTNAEPPFSEAPGHPGLMISFQHRAGNTLTGSFVIDDVTFGTDLGGNLFVQTFSASFVQYCEGSTAPLTGSFTYQAVPEPASMAALALGSVALLARRRRRRS